MYLAYSLLLTLGLIIYFLFKAWTPGKFTAGIRQRLGTVPQVDGKPVIWLHCVSVGETQAARPLVRRLKEEFPHYALVVSTITPTGQALAREIFRQQAESIFYFPVDWQWSVRRALKAINPAAVLIMETEIWPNFLRECKARHIPVALVNGRISRRSYRRYSRVKSCLGRRVLSSFSVAVMQSKKDARRLQTLGMAREKLFSAGNLKFDVEVAGELTSRTEEFMKRFDLRSGTPLIIAASTHSPEEKMMLESIKQLRAKQPVRLMLAPRRPERFDEVAALIQKSGLSWTRKTDAPQPEDANAAVILLDTIGDLLATYSLADVVFVGGSIVDRGGHNVLEPAAAGAAVVTGAHAHNFHAVIDLMVEAGALVQLPSSVATEKITNVFAELLANSGKRDELGRRAKQLVIDNKGAAERTIKLIAPFLTVNAHTS